MAVGRTISALSALLLAAGCAQADAVKNRWSPPATIDESSFTAKTFDERFEQLDVGTDQTPADARHRWRTVTGFGGPTALTNYKISKASLGIDPSFPGVQNGKLGSMPLGLNPFVLDPGKSLTIVARPIPEALRSKMWNAQYYSAQITTRFSFSQRYGYFEVDARLPAGKGFWPAFWLMPTTGKWPQGGEIDVFEGLGDPHQIYTTLHWGADHKHTQRKITLPFDASKEFHRYGVAWTKAEIVWYVDRREVMRVATPEEVNKPMFLLLTFAVGGPWGGYPDKNTVFPGRFVVRRVQAWQVPP